jgi:hypothetical protein
VRACDDVGSGIGFSGSLQGVYCSYTATLSPGEGNTASTLSTPAAQTSPPQTGLLASYTGLEVANWELELKGECGNGSMIRIGSAVVEGWVGAQGGTVSNRTLDDMSSVREYEPYLHDLIVSYFCILGYKILWKRLVYYKRT